MFNLANLKNVFEFAKKYWSIGAVFAVIIYFQLRVNSLNNQIKETAFVYTNQISEIQKIQKNQTEAQEKVFDEYKNQLTLIGDEFSKQLKSLERNRQKKIEIANKEFNEDPKKLIKNIEIKYGFKYVE